MSAINQNIQSVGKYPLSGTRERGYLQRGKELQAGSSKRTDTGYCFLKTVFAPKKAGSVLPVFTFDSYDYLYQSAENYSKLVGKQPPPKDNDTRKLLVYMKGLIDDRQDMTIVDNNGLVSFYIYFDTDFFLNKRYYIPCNIMDKTKGKFRKIITDLLLCLKTYGASVPLEDWGYFRFVEECEWHCKNAIKQDDISDDDKELMQLYEGCREGGNIDKLFKHLDKEKSDIERLKASVKSYKPKDSAEKKIISLIKRGIPLLENGHIRMNMLDAYDQLYEDRDTNEDGEFDDDGYEIYTIEQLFRFVYDTQDKLTEFLEQDIVQTLYSSAFEVYMDHIPAADIIVTPDMDKPLLPRPSELFFWWLEDLISAFENYGNKNLVAILDV